MRNLVPPRVAQALARSKRRNPLLLGGAALLGAAAWARRSRHADERRDRLGRDELRELSDMWTWVDDRCWYARFSAERHEHEYPPVVLVHGFGISSSYFVPVAERLAVRFDVYAPDLLGHGHSDTPPEPLDVAGLADELRAWLRTMRIERASVVGHSMGCQIAVALAARHPDVVDRLVLIGPTMDRESRSVARALPRFAAGSIHERPSMSLLVAKDYTRMNVRLLAELRAMFAHRIEESLPRVAAPLLIVRGEHDRIVPQRWVDELASLSPRSESHVVPGGGHAVHYSHPDAIEVMVRPFLERSGARTAAGA